MPPESPGKICRSQRALAFLCKPAARFSFTCACALAAWHYGLPCDAPVRVLLTEHGRLHWSNG